MIEGIGYSITLVLALLIFNLVLNSICGFGSSGELGGVIEGSIMIFLLYSIIVELFGASLNVEGVPFLDALESCNGMIDLFENNLGQFVLETAELISFTFLFTYVSKLIPSSFGGSSSAGKFIRYIALIMITFFVNHYFVSVFSNTEFFPWAKEAITCFFAGTAMVTTPVMMLGGLLHLSPENPFVLFLVKKLPETKIGKSISEATSNSLIWIGVTMIFESQFGSMNSLVAQVPGIIESLGGVVIAFFGFQLLLKTFSR